MNVHLLAYDKARSRRRAWASRSSSGADEWDLDRRQAGRRRGRLRAIRRRPT